MKKPNNAVRDDLSEAGRKLLALIVQHTHGAEFIPGKPETYLGYKDCCIAIGAAPPDADLPWGRLLQKHGLTDLNEWTIRHNLPRVSGLIVNQTGDRQFWPGGDYFASNGQADMDGVWWEHQGKEAAKLNWRLYL
jgi:hypothetical protein